MREFDRDLIRGGHYGQPSYEPRQKAGHMAAPTNAAKREESPCQPGAVHTWTFDYRARPCRSDHHHSAGTLTAAEGMRLGMCRNSAQTIAASRPSKASP